MLMKLYCRLQNICPVFLGGRGETLTTVILGNFSSQSGLPAASRYCPPLVFRAAKADFGVDGEFRIGCWNYAI